MSRSKSHWKSSHPNHIWRWFRNYLVSVSWQEWTTFEWMKMCVNLVLASKCTTQTSLRGESKDRSPTVYWKGEIRPHVTMCGLIFTADRSEARCMTLMRATTLSLSARHLSWIRCEALSWVARKHYTVNLTSGTDWLSDSVKIGTITGRRVYFITTGHYEESDPL